MSQLFFEEHLSHTDLVRAVTCNQDVTRLGIALQLVSVTPVAVARGWQ